MQTLITEVQHPEFLTAESLMVTAQSYREQESQFLFNRSAADSLVARGCYIAIEHLLKMTYGVPNEEIVREDGQEVGQESGDQGKQPAGQDQG